MDWKRKDQMTPRERIRIKEEFLESLANDPNRKWRVVILSGESTQYQISNDGKLASLRMCRMMTPHPNVDGYLETILAHNGKRLNVSIHRLVAEAFIPNPNNLPQVNHKDGKKQNNWDWNLEWLTLQNNITHAIETGLRDNYVAINRYSNKDIHKVCKLLEKDLPVSKIVSKTGVSKRVIKSIKRGKSWKHISKHYEIINLKEQASTTIQSLDKSDITPLIYDSTGGVQIWISE